ncbi:ankyrin repeat and SOCS box protein 10 isoform X4 [Felis catus]|uniref:ankyrin repeat and SOCS box protein 10 isoform X4 n=1 Tax=Felis catus TaxID=9685 RepID=UPI001D19C306|nr:ankyrin repeat and SOCS box protein 10 isoform X4 [Felis catus]
MACVCSPAPPTPGLGLAQAPSASGIVPRPASLAPSLPETGYAWKKELPSPWGHRLGSRPSAPACRVWGSRSGPAREPTRPSPLLCRDMALQNALYTGDLARLQELFPPHSTADLVLEHRAAEPRWSSHQRGLWSLTYEEELTTPLHVAASRGHTDILRLLLRRRARPDSAPGGRTALHEACAAGHAACVHVLLVAGADPNIPDQDGKLPLHLCRGAGTLESKEEEVRDLLWADGMGLQRALPRCRARSRGLQVCAVLSQGPCSRHPAARGTCRIPSLPGRRVLKSPMLHVLERWCTSPRTIEVLMNTYSITQLPEEAMALVPPETLQKHHRFYSSLFALVRQPRSLQHLSRCALRAHLAACLPHALPRLPLPPRLLRYVQLDFEDVLY